MSHEPPEMEVIRVNKQSAYLLGLVIIIGGVYVMCRGNLACTVRKAMSLV